MMMLVGLGVGIDYALLIFSRFRTELRQGRTRTEAAVTAQRTAGRSVLFAGVTVIVALLGLIVLGLGSLRGRAVAVAVTVLLTMVASATLLPVLLTLFGPRLERTIRKRAAWTGNRVPGQGWRRTSDVIAARPFPALRTEPSSTRARSPGSPCRQLHVSSHRCAPWPTPRPS